MAIETAIGENGNLEFNALLNGEPMKSFKIRCYVRIELHNTNNHSSSYILDSLEEGREVGTGSRGGDLVGQAEIQDNSSGKVTGEKEENKPRFQQSSPRASISLLISPIFFMKKYPQMNFEKEDEDYWLL